MALDDIPFYNVLGEEISREYLVNQIIGFYTKLLQIGETKVTDFNEGSEIRDLIEAFAVDVYIDLENSNEVTKIAFVETAYGEWLDKHGRNPELQLERNKGTEAIGILTFTIPEPRTGETVIPEGTVVTSTENGLDYITDVEAIIPVGETSVTVGATCLTVGDDGNVDAETITLINDEYILDNGLSVNNARGFEDGSDYEEDDAYRKRLLNYKRKDDFGSLPYYQELGASVEGVHDIVLTPIDGYTSKLLVNGYDKPTPDSVLVDVLVAFTETSNIVLNHYFIADKPYYVDVDLLIDMDVNSTIPESAILEGLYGYFNGGSVLSGLDYDGLNIGESVRSIDLINMLYVFDGLANVTVTYEGETDFVIEAAEDEVLRLNDVTITQNIVG